MTTSNSGDDVTRSAPWLALVRRCRSTLPGKTISLTSYECKLIKAGGEARLLEAVGMGGARLLCEPDKLAYFTVPKTCRATPEAVAAWNSDAAIARGPAVPARLARPGEWYTPLGDHVLRLNNAISTIRALTPGDAYVFDQQFVQLLNSFVGMTWLQEVRKVLGEGFSIVGVNDLISVRRATPVDHLPEHPRPDDIMQSTPKDPVSQILLDSVNDLYPAKVRTAVIAELRRRGVAFTPTVTPEPWHRRQPPWPLAMSAGAVFMFALLACAGLLR